MTPNPDDVVKVAAADMVTIEMYQRALKEAGIESNAVGGSLTAFIGASLPTGMELYVHAGDAERAAAAIRDLEAHKGEGAE